MIRFVTFNDAVDHDGKNKFAFFNTYTDKFVEFAGSQAWESEEQLLEDVQIAYGKGPEYKRWYERLVPFIPDGFGVKNESTS